MDLLSWVECLADTTEDMGGRYDLVGEATTYVDPHTSSAGRLPFQMMIEKIGGGTMK